MRMIDIMESILQYGMEIYDIRENKTKTKFTFVYKDMEQLNCEIPNTCRNGYEEDLCKKTISKIIYEMYIHKGDLEEAEKWSHGGGWILGKDYRDKNKLLRIKIEQLIEDIENKTQNRNMNDLEQERYNTLNEVLEIMDEF